MKDEFEVLLAFCLSLIWMSFINILHLFQLCLIPSYFPTSPLCYISREVKWILTDQCDSLRRSLTAWHMRLHNRCDCLTEHKVVIMACNHRPVCSDNREKSISLFLHAEFCDYMDYSEFRGGEGTFCSPESHISTAQILWRKSLLKISTFSRWKHFVSFRCRANLHAHTHLLVIYAFIQCVSVCVCV